MATYTFYSQGAGIPVGPAHDAPFKRNINIPNIVSGGTNGGLGVGVENAFSGRTGLVRNGGPYVVRPRVLVRNGGPYVLVCGDGACALRAPPFGRRRGMGHMSYAIVTRVYVYGPMDDAASKLGLSLGCQKNGL